MKIYRFKVPLDKTPIDQRARQINSAIINYLDAEGFYNLDTRLRLVEIHTQVIVDAYLEYQKEVIWPKLISLAESKPVFLLNYNGSIKSFLSDRLAEIFSDYFQGSDNEFINLGIYVEGRYDDYYPQPDFYNVWEAVIKVADLRFAMLLKLEGFEEMEDAEHPEGV